MGSLVEYFFDSSAIACRIRLSSRDITTHFEIQTQIKGTRHKNGPTHIKTIPAIRATSIIPTPTKNNTIARMTAEINIINRHSGARSHGATAALMLSMDPWNSSGRMIPPNSGGYVESNSDRKNPAKQMAIKFYQIYATGYLLFFVGIIMNVGGTSIPSICRSNHKI